MIDSRRPDVRRRFDREPATWQASHEAPVRDIIGWEIARRKQIARDALIERFGGRPARILEVGCGAGDNLGEIIRADPRWTAVGVDIAPNMVEHCRARFADEPRLAFEVLDVEETALDQQFDAIVLLGVVGYFDSTRRALGNVGRMLAPGGRLVFTYGRKPSLSRAVRAGVRRLRGLLPGSVSSPTHFRCLTDTAVRGALPEGIRVQRLHHLAFAAGTFGGFSVGVGRLLERLFESADPFRLALTALVVADSVAAPTEPRERLGP